MPNLYNTIHLLKSRLKGLPQDLMMMSGLTRSVLKSAGGNRLLLYHGICKSDPLRFNTLFVRLKLFENHLRLYKKYFNIISLDQYYEQRYSREKFNVCLSFDDGFANNYKYVLPLLEKYQVPAAFFITGIRASGYEILWNDVLAVAYQYGPEKIRLSFGEFIKRRDKKYVSVSDGKLLAEFLRGRSFEEKKEMIIQLGKYKEKANEDYWLQMTEQQIKILSASQWVTIGSHGYFHNDLSQIEPGKVKEEMILSKQFLERITGNEVKALAFPYGCYTPGILQEAKKAGFSQLLATTFLFPDDACDATLRERLTINPFISNNNQMHANITGHYK